jgi:hypothetical protein
MAIRPARSLLLAAVACAAATRQSPPAPPAPPAAEAAARVVAYDQPFRLAFGRSARLEHTPTRVRFAELLEDSRCPSGVQCIQAGRVRVRLEVSRGRERPVAVEVSTDPDGFRSGGGATWELAGAEPARRAGDAVEPEDYVITLIARPLRGR